MLHPLKCASLDADPVSLSGRPARSPELRVRHMAIGIRAEFGPDAVEEIHVDRADMLDLHLPARLGLEQARYVMKRARRDVHPSGLAGLLQALSDIHRIAPDVIGEAPLPHDAGNHRAGIDADAQLPGRKPELFALPVGVADEGLHLQGCEAGIDRVGAIGLGQASRTEISIADRLDGLEPVHLGNVVEPAEILIELGEKPGGIEGFGQEREFLEVRSRES